MKKIQAKFAVDKPGRKWEYATIKLKAPRGWEGFTEYNYGPALYFNKGTLTIYVRRKRRKCRTKS